MSEQSDSDALLGCLFLLGIAIVGMVATATALAVVVGLLIRLVRLIAGMT